MKRRLQFLSCAALFVAAAQTIPAVAADAIADLRRAVPAAAYLFVHSAHNPERDFQREHFQEVWQTVEETQIIGRLVEIVTSRIDEDELATAQGVLDQLRAAAAPIDLQAILDAKECVYAQEMGQMSANHLLLLRLTPEAADSCETGVTNLFKLVEQHSQGHVTVQMKDDDSGLTILNVPQGVPFRPCVAHVGDVVLMSTSEELAANCLTLLRGEAGQSKFDDPRLVSALAQLPKPEDSLTFYDQRQQLQQLQGMMSFIRTQGGDNQEVGRIVDLAEMALDEVMILDYEITVEYTQGNQNRSVAMGKLAAGGEAKLLTKVFGTGQPFDDWQRWVPRDATTYSLSTGANLHPLYEWVRSTIREQVPELHEPLDQFDQWQEANDFYVDRDVLQAFSGESVSVTLSNGQSVTALRCQKPDRVHELLHRLVELSSQHPFLATQQIRLEACNELDDFEELSCSLLGGFGVRPAIGFRDGWMMIGSNADAVQTVLEVKAGEQPSVADSDAFGQFELEVDGPVHAISYSNLAAGTRQAAAMLEQAGTFAPMAIGMAGAQADAKALQVLQELLGLLPDIAKIVAKFDFYEAKLSVTQEGPTPDTYLRRGVVLVRPADAE